MIFPKWIREGDTIGVTALSDGVYKETDKIRFENGKKQLESRGFEVVMTPNVFMADEKGRSSIGGERATQLASLIKDENVTGIISAKGGNYLMEMLPYVDFDEILRNPKWIQGYSDNTSLIYYLTTKYDLATVYGCNFGDFGMEEWSRSVLGNIAVLKGEEKTQKSFEYFEDGFHDRITGLEGYYKDMPVCWKNLRGEEELKIKGRLIGGCLDVLLNITGTRYDGTLEFCEKYKNDGIVFYFETYDLNSEELMMGLWHLKELGWFKYASGFVFGRPLIFDSWTNTGFDEVVDMILGDLEIPIILDADIGHKGPQFVIINGAVGEFTSKNGKGELKIF